MSYQAHITGYSLNDDSLPTLDSIKIATNKQYIYQTITIEKPITYKKKLITTSPSIMAGYDPINKNFGMMVGVSVNFNIW